MPASPSPARKSRIPDGYHTVTPHLVVRGCAKAIEFYKKAFGAIEELRNLGPDGVSVWHARLRIGDSVVVMHDELPEAGHHSPAALGGSAVTIHLYVEDADALFNRAVAAGATVLMPIEDVFWGDRYGRIQDPFGHYWSIAHQLQPLTPEDMRRRAGEMLGG